MSNENFGKQSSDGTGSDADGEARAPTGKAAWVAPTLIRLDGRETQSIIPHGPSHSIPKPQPMDLLMGS